MAFRNILVPVDTSAENQRALELACQLASSHADGTVLLLHVIETIDDEAEDEVRDFYATLEQQARAAMDGMVDGITNRPPAIECRISYGHRVPEILAVARECAADLVVVRSHRLEPGRPGAGLGTLSHEVALLAEIPVLLVK